MTDSADCMAVFSKQCKQFLKVLGGSCHVTPLCHNHECETLRWLLAKILKSFWQPGHSDPVAN